MALTGVGPSFSTPQPHLSLSHAENTWLISDEEQASSFLTQVRTESLSPPTGPHTQSVLSFWAQLCTCSCPQGS